MKKGNDQYTPYLFMAGVVAMVSIVALVLNGASSLEGAASYGKQEADVYVETCTDDDPGNDFFKSGTVNKGPYKYEDYCQDGQVTQYFCDTGDSLGTTRPFTCPIGCAKGRCLVS